MAGSGSRAAKRFFAVFSGIGVVHWPLAAAPAGPMKVAGGKTRPQGETHPPATRSKRSRAPAGRMTKVPTANLMRPAGARTIITNRSLVSPSFPPATFMRASSAKRPTGFIPPKTAGNQNESGATRFPVAPVCSRSSHCKPLRNRRGDEAATVHQPCFEIALRQAALVTGVVPGTGTTFVALLVRPPVASTVIRAD